MFRRMMMVLLLAAGFQTAAVAQEPSKVEAALAGSTIKTLARAYIAAADLNELKNNTIEKLNRMGPERYRREYAKDYKVFKDFPPGLKKKYGVVEDMPKSHLIRVVLSLDKKQVYQIIEAIPNATIARRVNEYFRVDDPAVQDKSFIERVKMVWHDVAVDIGQKPPARAQ